MGGGRNLSRRIAAFQTLYEPGDRIVSAGGVGGLATQVFGMHTPVAVAAAATLAAAALSSSVRRWVQRRVDRRFNRARYDADQTVLEAAHVPVWTSPRD